MNFILTLFACVAGVILPGILALLLLGNPLLSMVVATFAFLIEILAFIWCWLSGPESGS